MLIVYSKSSGEIRGIYSGDLQSIDSLYGKDAQEYKIIWDELKLEDDEYILNNWRNFIVDVNNGNILKLKDAEELRKYL